MAAVEKEINIVLVDILNIALISFLQIIVAMKEKANPIMARRRTSPKLT